MREWRLVAYEAFTQAHMPSWGVDLTALDFSQICFYCKPFGAQARSWDDVPSHIKDTFDKLGIPQAEQHALAGVSAQYESEILYKNLKDTWKAQGVIFCSLDEAVQLYPEKVKQYLGSIVPIRDNIFAALNSAVWSGGSFIYVPKGVTVELPVQAYFRMQAERMGQFERTLIIADEQCSVHYLEGCSAPLYSTQSLHSAVVEIFVADAAHVRYTTIQNWSANVYNMVTKRALVGGNAHIEWIDGNFGSCATMKYPCMILQGERAKGFMMSLAVAGAGQHQHTGGKVVHRGHGTHATIISKSISHSGGIAAYAGSIVVEPSCIGARSHVQCDSLLLDGISRATSTPYIKIGNSDAHVGHEASVCSFDEQQLLYLASRGISHQVVRTLLINGFVGSFVNELPMEYAVELNRLIILEMDHSIG
jgi:Fe-S cluster assembly protein SufB